MTEPQIDRRKLSHDRAWNQKISQKLKGRTPWNKGLGNEHPSIRKGIKTRREFKGLRELIKIVNGKERGKCR